MALLLVVKKIGKPIMTQDLADLDQDAETPKDEVYVSNADAGADLATC